jgi:hypothetical protein
MVVKVVAEIEYRYISLKRSDDLIDKTIMTNNRPSDEIVDNHAKLNGKLFSSTAGLVACFVPSSIHIGTTNVCYTSDVASLQYAGVVLRR